MVPGLQSALVPWKGDHDAMAGSEQRANRRRVSLLLSGAGNESRPRDVEPARKMAWLPRPHLSALVPDARTPGGYEHGGDGRGFFFYFKPMSQN